HLRSGPCRDRRGFRCAGPPPPSRSSDTSIERACRMTTLNDRTTIEELAARVSRLEAAQAVRQAHNDYFYLIDSGKIDDLLNVFTDDAAWSSSNIPFGPEPNLKLKGRSQIRLVFDSLGSDGFRHHGTNVDIQVDETAESAASAAYMLVVVRSTE